MILGYSHCLILLKPRRVTGPNRKRATIFLRHGAGMSSDSNPPSQEFIDWLAKLNLSHYQDAACEWWITNGAISLSEVIENWEVFATDLALKPLERKRVEKDVANNAFNDSRFNHRLSQEVSEWLSELHLSHYTTQLLHWCQDNGASTMEEVWFSWEDFSEKLDVKPLERKRIERDVASRASSPAVPIAPRPTVQPEKGMFGPPEDPRMYQLIEEIGFGVTSKVWKCCRGKDIYAVKVISLKRLRHQPGFTRIADRLHQEIEILLSLKHEHVVKLVDVVEEEDCLYLVMELVSGGELGEWIVKKGVFSELTARHVFMQIVEGLAYIHSKGIIHRDLKPDNILVDAASTPEKLEVKLSDFGHSRLINDGLMQGLQRRLTARIGTAMYWAPEVSDPALAAMGYDQSADVWSLGVVLYVMLIGFFPFESGDHLGDRLQEDVNNLTFKPRSSGPELSADAQDLLRSLLVIDPHKRLPLKKCLSHRWTSGQLDHRFEYMKLSTDPNPSAVEVRVPLIVKPEAEALQLLRVELQKWMYKFRRFAAIRHGEVIANLGESSQADLPESKAARRELQAIVERHCGRGMIVVNDQKMWTAIAGSKNETLHCPVKMQPKHTIQPEKEDSTDMDKNTATVAVTSTPTATTAATAATAVPKKPMVLLTRQGPQLPQTTPVEWTTGSESRSTTGPTVESECNDMEGARFALTALQGFWESQRDSSETYSVKGMDVTRHQRQGNGGVQRRPYSLRWNTSKRCLEWGSGKYYLQPPESLPMMEAVWLACDGGRGFAWRRSNVGGANTRKGKGKGAKTRGDSTGIEENQTIASRRHGGSTRY